MATPSDSLAPKKTSFTGRFSRSFLNRLLGFSLLVNVLFTGCALFSAFYFRERLLQWYLDWKGDTEIVFFGDSITAQGQWNKLMSRCDIKNSGVPGLGVCHLKEELDQKVFRFSPQVCVVMGGINDLTILERTVEQTISDYREMLSRLDHSEIRTVVQLTLYERQSPATQVKVDSLNNWLVAFCDSLAIPVVNPNEWLSDHTGLQRGFAGDRTHLTQEAYHVWAQNLLPILERELRIAR